MFDNNFPFIKPKVYHFEFVVVIFHQNTCVCVSVYVYVRQETFSFGSGKKLNNEKIKQTTKYF